MEEEENAEDDEAALKAAKKREKNKAKKERKKAAAKAGGAEDTSFGDSPSSSSMSTSTNAASLSTTATSNATSTASTAVHGNGTSQPFGSERGAGFDANLQRGPPPGFTASAPASESGSADGLFGTGAPATSAGQRDQLLGRLGHRRSARLSVRERLTLARRITVLGVPKTVPLSQLSAQIEGELARFGSELEHDPPWVLGIQWTESSAAVDFPTCTVAHAALGLRRTPKP